MKRTSSSQDPQAVETLRSLIEQISVAMVTTATPEAVLRSRPMFTLQFEEQGELWFFTSDDSGKVDDLDAEHAVNVSYADPAHDRYVSISGNAAIVHDTDKIHDLWQDSFTRFFPQGLDDPHLALLRVRIETAEYWDAGAGKMTSLSKPAPLETNGTVEETHTRIDIRATPSSG